MAVNVLKAEIEGKNSSTGAVEKWHTWWSWG